jgi:hypothetical protein
LYILKTWPSGFLKISDDFNFQMTKWVAGFLCAIVALSALMAVLVMQVLQSQVRDADMLIEELVERLARMEALATRLDVVPHPDGSLLPRDIGLLYAHRVVRSRPNNAIPSQNFRSTLHYQLSLRSQWLSMFDSSKSIDTFVRALFEDWEQAKPIDRVSRLRHWFACVASVGFLCKCIILMFIALTICTEWTRRTCACLRHALPIAPVASSAA